MAEAGEVTSRSICAYGVIMKTDRTLAATRRGQAMVELIVALVAILVVLTGLTQIGQFGILHSETMRKARRDAGLLAVQDAQAWSAPDYILDRTPGADNRRYSRDDDFTAANPADFASHVVAYANPMTLQNVIAGNRVSALWNSSFPQLSFGFVHGDATETTNLLPVVRHLIYDAETLNVQSHVWMTWTRGIY